MPRLPVALILGTVLTLVGCGGSDGDGTTTAATPPEESAADTSSSTTTAAEVDGGAAASALVGEWHADGAYALAANLSNLGGVPKGINCAGPITLSFDAGGSYVASGEVTCSVGGVSLTASLSTTGGWEIADDGTVSLTGAVSEGGFDMPGVEIPPIDLVSDGNFAYTIAGDVLTITFTDPSVGTVSQTWTRA